MAEEQLTRQMQVALFATGLSVMIIGVDFTAMNVALPEIQLSFDIDIVAAQWVINALTFAFAVIIVTGGRLADLFGRRRTYVVGMSIFAVASFVGGFAPNVYWLIGARALMGVGGAIMFPAAIGIAYETLPESRSGLAGAVINGSVGFGQVIGPLLGGVLAGFTSWRFILMMNLPVALLAMVLVWRTIPHDTESAQSRRIDYAGSILLAVGLLALLFVLSVANDWGWGDQRTLSTMVAAVLVIIAFVIVELRSGQHALIPRDVISNHAFMLTSLAVLLLAFPTFAVALFLSQIMEKIFLYSPMETGIALVPMYVSFVCVSYISGRAYDRLGAKFAIVMGALLLVIGCLLFAAVPTDPDYLWLVPGMLVFGAGIGSFFSAATTVGVTALRSDQTSLGGGIIYMFRVIGGSLGIVLTTAVLSFVGERDLSRRAEEEGVSLPVSQIKEIVRSMAGQINVDTMLPTLPPDVANAIMEHGEAAYMTGFRAGMLFNSAVMAIGLLIVLFFVGGPLRIQSLSLAERSLRSRIARHIHHYHG